MTLKLFMTAVILAGGNFTYQVLNSQHNWSTAFERTYFACWALATFSLMYGRDFREKD